MSNHKLKTLRQSRRRNHAKVIDLTEDARTVQRKTKISRTENNIDRTLSHIESFSLPIEMTNQLNSFLDGTLLGNNAIIQELHEALDVQRTHIVACNTAPFDELTDAARATVSNRMYCIRRYIFITSVGVRHYCPNASDALVRVIYISMSQGLCGVAEQTGAGRMVPMPDVSVVCTSISFLDINRFWNSATPCSSIAKCYSSMAKSYRSMEKCYSSMEKSYSSMEKF